MKLRSKIILISSIAIFLSLVISNCLIYSICSDLMLKEAEDAAYIEAEELRKSFNLYVSSMKTDVGKPEIKYFFQKNGDNYSVCIKDGDDFYNNTVLSIEDFEKGNYTYKEHLGVKRYNAFGRNILIYKFNCVDSTYLYHIVDITHVYDRLNVIAVLMVVISAAVIIVSLTVLFLLVKRMMSPLKELSDVSKHIAEGAYSKRVPIRTKDEIGILANDFNTMAEAVEQNTKILKESEYKKTMFMGCLTHELKTPLTAISGYAQTMRTVELSEADKHDALTYIYEESKRLDRLSKKMMRLIELDRESDLLFGSFLIADLFSAVRGICDVLAEQKKVKIEIGEQKGNIEGDFDLLCDLLINLTDNAIKASYEGGLVKLYTEEGNIVVEDFGGGIPKEDVLKITEPFYMVDKSRSRKNGGVGLGLTLCKLILDRHNMSMVIDSRVNEGTKISIKYKND